MAQHIPFVSTGPDCEILKKYYADSEIVRVSLDSSFDSIRQQLPKKMPMWIDPIIDGYHHLLTGTIRPENPKHKRQYQKLDECYQRYDDPSILTNTSFLAKPEDNKVQAFVFSVLNRCLKYNPSWITVPQLPLVTDTSRNKINRALAKATKEWKLQSQFTGKLILPLIFTQQDQLRKKTIWGAKLKTAKSCFKDAKANGVWTVDSTLDDHSGSGTYDKRFPELIKFHQALRKDFPPKTPIIAGPYWGMNIVLWARELCDYPAISLGTGYQYHISLGHIRLGSVRAAIPPLRRRVVMSPAFREWLDKALNLISDTDSAYKEFISLKENDELFKQYEELLSLKNNYDLYTERDVAKEQIAHFYKQWFNQLDDIPPAGRTLALYQDLSSAYVLGKQLETLPKTEKTGRRPERIVKQLMLNCL